jgi:Tubulin binding cofactor A
MENYDKKQLIILLGVLKGIVDECESLQDDIEKDRKRISNLKEYNADKNSIKKFESLVSTETEMVMNTRLRLQDFTEDIELYLKHTKNPEVQASKEWIEAKNLIKIAKELL